MLSFVMPLFSRFKRVADKEGPAITVELLEEHLDSIRLHLLEIRNFKKKRIMHNPTHVHWKSIDIEEAWPSCREVFLDAYAVFGGIANTLQTVVPELPEGASFVDALDYFSYLVARVEMHLASSDVISRFSQEQLEEIDQRILTIQHVANRLHKHVVQDFVYTGTANRTRPT